VEKYEHIDGSLGHCPKHVIRRILAGLPVGIAATAFLAEWQIYDLATNLAHAFDVVMITGNRAVVADLPL
jgi:hypothetical protein